MPEEVHQAGGRHPRGAKGRCDGGTGPLQGTNPRCSLFLLPDANHECSERPGEQPGGDPFLKEVCAPRPFSWPAESGPLPSLERIVLAFRIQCCPVPAHRVSRHRAWSPHCFQGAIMKRPVSGGRGISSECLIIPLLMRGTLKRLGSLN